MAEESKGKPSAAGSADRGIDLEQLSNAAKALRGMAKPIIEGLTFVIPIIITYATKAYEHWKKLPQNAITFIIGFVFCFFGGLYPTLFAAIQAAEYGGRKKIAQALSDLSEEALGIIEASKKDDEVDADGDGKSDAKVLSGTDYLARKTQLVLKKMNPQKVDNAMQSIYQVWLSVAAVLSIKFARTIALALSIAEFLKKPIDRFIAPTIQIAVPDEYDRWVPVILSWIARSIAMSIAWYIQSVISAFTSALTGGLMIARATYQFCVHRGWTLGGLIPEDDTKSFVDEGLSYVFAALGFYFQFSLNFSMPFPFNVLLFPFEIAEYYIRASITYAKAP